MRIGVVHDAHFAEGSDPAALEAFDDALAELEALGAELVDVSIPYYAEVNAACMVTMLSEAFAYHRNDMQARWGDYYERTRSMLSWGALDARIKPKVPIQPLCRLVSAAASPSAVSVLESCPGQTSPRLTLLRASILAHGFASKQTKLQSSLRI